MSKDDLKNYIPKLKEKFAILEKEDTKTKSMLHRELTTIEKKLERLIDLYLEGNIETEDYKIKKCNLEVERDEIKNKISNFKQDNKEIEISLEYLLQLVSRFNSIYKSSGIAVKRKILKLLFPHFLPDGSNLCYTIRKPFDMMVKRANRPLNWRIGDSNS